MAVRARSHDRCDEYQRHDTQDGVNQEGAGTAPGTHQVEEGCRRYQLGASIVNGGEAYCFDAQPYREDLSDQQSEHNPQSDRKEADRGGNRHDRDPGGLARGTGLKSDAQ